MKTKIGIIIVFVMLIVIFALQNTEIISVKLWFWEVQTPRALLILLCIAIGLFIGFLVPSPARKEKQDEEE
ncbi:lipopolysaccharide assembly protein LapA domain-containing protein [Labilibaculum sp.]|uniref:lipopolysaccharide assembly protein LapA domain-containing protein n=1 Tax=Labilibaculum sp. TaxID=2060723 RepID=UPI003565B047